MGTQRSGSAVLRRNERIKHIAGSVTAWGNALVLAAFGKWGFAGFDAYVVLWLAGAAVLIWGASHSLTMLKVEESDG